MLGNQDNEMRRMLDILVGLNKTIVKEQYRRLLLKVHDQKKVKLINPKDPQFFYLN